MTEKTQHRQLTIDGGEVPHPPPRPRVKCRSCDKWITLNADGTLRRHSNGWGYVCPNAGQRYAV